MATKSQIASDIELRLTRGKPSDDLELDRRQIYFWMDSSLDAFVHNELVNSLAKGETLDPSYITKEECKIMIEEIKDCFDCKPRFYLTITKDVMDLPKDKGIIRVMDTRGVSLKHFEKEQIEMLELLEFARPTQTNQAFYRENRNIYIEKANKKMIDIVKYHVFYIPANLSVGIDEDDEYPIPTQLLPEFISFIEDIANRQMSRQFEDLEADGKQA